jgi:hypothetical protein
VQGHAQRDYEALAAFLGESLGREVTVRFGESLDAFAGEGFDVVIGKRSVVEADAARLGLDVVPIAALAGRDGLTTQRGLVVVRGDDPARTVADLEQHRILLGPADCDEKHAAARASPRTASICPRTARRRRRAATAPQPLSRRPRRVAHRRRP